MRGKTEREREDQPVKHAGINFHDKRQDYDINIPRETTGIGYTVSEPTRLTIHYCSGVSRRRRRAEQLFPRARASQLTA